MRFLLVPFLSLVVNLAWAKAQHEGYAIIKRDTIYGNIKINFDAGSITVSQDSINRMYLSDIHMVTFLNDSRDTYLTYLEEGKTTFYKALVKGESPLLEKEERLYAVIDGAVKIIDEKVIYELFGKKEVKEYAFIRNISLADKAGLIDLFRYYNNYIDL